ncbi:MAG: hypothetical protein LBT14_04405 [Treponema sp.]|nr:hypothetical protein [Treponema sp.]
MNFRMWLDFFANVDLFMTETCKYAMGMSRITPGRKNAATVPITRSFPIGEIRSAALICWTTWKITG